MTPASGPGIVTGMPKAVLVRMPQQLHTQLVKEAANEGVSLNHLAVALLAGGVGFKLEEGKA